LKLDEWGGLPMDDPATCETQLRASLIEPLRLEKRYIAFESQPPDPQAECRRIAAWLDRNGPIDVSILGLGINGHLGFNEPAEVLQPHAHVAELSGDSLSHTMLRRSGRRPKFGLTLGIDDLLTSRKVLLLVSGESKRQALKRLLEEPITAAFPASFLQKRSDVVLLTDAAARGGLPSK
jgi:galactosamine-6-phosphate isomerase